MNMTFLQSVVMGLVSGLAELLPISAEAHRAVLRCLMGQSAEPPLTALAVHLGAFLALCWCLRKELGSLHRARSLLRVPPRQRRTQPDMADVFTMRLLSAATVLMVLGRIFTGRFEFMLTQLHLLALNLVLNGVILLIPRLCRSGNKDSRNMPRLDGLLMGLGAAVGVVPGFSLVGVSAAAGMARGVDRKYAVMFAFHLLLRGLAVSLVFDLLGLMGGGMETVTLTGAVSLVAMGLCALAGALVAHKALRFLAYSTDLSAFSYYCFGAGLFVFILFLFI